MSPGLNFRIFGSLWLYQPVDMVVCYITVVEGGAGADSITITEYLLQINYHLDIRRH